MKRRSVRFVGPRRVSVVEEEVPVPGPDEVLVETVASAISAGTELLFYRDEVPPHMAVDQTLDSLGSGSSGYPIAYGYSAAGRVTSLGAGVDPSWMGAKVFAFHPHTSHFTASRQSLLALPEELGFEAAALLPAMETAVSLVMDGRPTIGERVAVFGLGTVGLFVAMLLSEMPLDRLVAVDPLTRRRATAAKLGATTTIDPSSSDAGSALRAALDEPAGDVLGADLAFELSGAPRALDAAIESVGYEGRVIVGSWYGTKPAALSGLGGNFHRNHVRIQSSQVSRVDSVFAGRWSKARRLETALRALERVDVATLISHRIPLDQAGEAYEMLCERPEDALQVILTH